MTLGFGHRFRGGRGADAAASGGGKELDRVAMGFPILPEQFQGALG
jgi:hypothetical protein